MTQRPRRFVSGVLSSASVASSSCVSMSPPSATDQSTSSMSSRLICPPGTKAFASRSSARTERRGRRRAAPTPRGAAPECPGLLSRSRDSVKSRKGRQRRACIRMGMAFRGSRLSPVYAMQGVPVSGACSARGFVCVWSNHARSASPGSTRARRGLSATDPASIEDATRAARRFRRRGLLYAHEETPRLRCDGLQRVGPVAYLRIERRHLVVPLQQRGALPYQRAYPDFVRVAGVYAPPHLRRPVLRGAYHRVDEPPRVSASRSRAWRRGVLLRLVEEYAAEDGGHGLPRRPRIRPDISRV